MATVREKLDLVVSKMTQHPRLQDDPELIDWINHMDECVNHMIDRANIKVTDEPTGPVL